MLVPKRILHCLVRPIFVMVDIDVVFRKVGGDSRAEQTYSSFVRARCCFASWATCRRQSRLSLVMDVGDSGSDALSGFDLGSPWGRLGVDQEAIRGRSGVNVGIFLGGGRVRAIFGGGLAPSRVRLWVDVGATRCRSGMEFGGR